MRIKLFYLFQSKPILKNNINNQSQSQMLKNKYFFLTFLIIASITQNTNTQSPPKPKTSESSSKFPKLLWTYWDTGFIGAKLPTRLCILNKMFYAEQSGWKFMFLTQQNYTNYISTDGQKRIKKMIEGDGKYLGKPHIVDIIRLVLLYENGGMWLDASTFFLGNLSWIDNLNKNTKGLYNNIGDYPEILTFSTNKYYGENKVQNGTYIIPGIQIWCIIAIKNNRFLRDWINLAEHFLDIGFERADNFSKQNGLEESKAKAVYFITSNFPSQTVLHIKEKQLQGINNSKMHAVQYYRMWTIDSQYGPFAIQISVTFVQTQIWKALSQNNLEYYEQKLGMGRYFIKFVGKTTANITEKMGRYYHNPEFKYEQPVKAGSIIDKYLLRFDQESQQVKSIQIRSIQTSVHGNQKEYQKRNLYVFVLSFIVIIFVIIVLKVKGNVMRECEATRKNSQQNLKIQNQLQTEDETKSIQNSFSAIENEFITRQV